MIVDNPEKFTKSTLTFKTSYDLSQEEILRRHLAEQEKIQAKLQAIAAKEQERLQAEAAKERERLQKEAEIELKRQQEEAALEKQRIEEEARIQLEISAAKEAEAALRIKILQEEKKMFEEE